MYDIIIIGGGIVGLATALHLLEQQPGINVLILEKEKEIAQHQTGNNSGVIHSGIYYKPGSLRAVNCLRGYKMLLEFCDAENIPYDICGKIIVATGEDELVRLQNIYLRGLENGLTGMELLDEKAIRDYKIRQMYKDMRREMSAGEAIDKIQEMFPYLQFDTIRKIVYQVSK